MTTPTPPSAAIAEKSPRIYTRCPACHNDTLTVNADKHLLCTWIDCPNPTLIHNIDSRVGPLVEALKGEIADLDDELIGFEISRSVTKESVRQRLLKLRAALSLWSQGGKEESGEVATQHTKECAITISGIWPPVCRCTCSTVQPVPSADEGTPDEPSWEVIGRLNEELMATTEQLSTALAERDEARRSKSQLQVGYEKALNDLGAELAKVKEENIHLTNQIEEIIRPTNEP